MDNQGWIKLHRSFVDWEWFDKPGMVWLFVKCLLLANHEDRQWHGITIPRGSFVTSYQNLSSKKAGFGVQSIRTMINRLKSTGELTIKTTNKYTVVSINNYNKYQEINKQTNTQLTNNQQTTNNKQERKEVKNREVRNTYVGEYINKYNDLYRSHSQITKARQVKYGLRLKTFKHEDIMRALDLMSKQDFYRGLNDRGWVPDPDYLIRSDENVDKFLAGSKPIKKTTYEQIVEAGYEF